MARGKPAGERSIERIQAEFEELDRLGQGPKARKLETPGPARDRPVAVPRPVEVEKRDGPRPVEPRERPRPVAPPRLQVEPERYDRPEIPAPPIPQLSPGAGQHLGPDVIGESLGYVERVARQARNAALFAAFMALLAAVAAIFAVMVELAGLPPF